MQAKRDWEPSMVNDEKLYRQLLGIFKSSSFGLYLANPILLTNCAVKSPHYMGSPYGGVLVGCPSQAPNQQPALSSSCGREPSSLCKVRLVMTASVTVHQPLSPMAHNNPVNPLNSREKRNCFRPMIFGMVYDAVMGKNTQQGSQSEKEDMRSRKQDQKEQSWGESLIVDAGKSWSLLDRVYDGFHCQRKLCRSGELVHYLKYLNIQEKISDSF